MCYGHDQSTIFKDSTDLSLGLIYPIICITCAFFLVRRIRGRQHSGYTLLGRQMDTPSEKSGGEQSSGATNEDFVRQSETAHSRAPLPSACDILRPLSLSAPLPPSGYLAAVLAEKRSNPTQYQPDSELERPSSSPGSSSQESTSVAWRTGRDRPSGTESSPTQTDSSSQATFSPISRSTDGDDGERLFLTDSGQMQSVQNRRQQVQFLHDVDEEGVRTWRRWVIEYS